MARRNSTPLLLASSLVWLALAGTATAQRGEPPPAASPQPEERKEQQPGGARTEAPAPPADEPVADGRESTLEQVLNEVTAVVEPLHREVTAITMSAPAAWGVLASPALLLLLVWVIIRRRRRPRPAPKKTKTKTKTKSREEGERGGGKGINKQRKDKKKEEPEALELPREGVVLLGPDGPSPSLFETLLGLGVEEDTFELLTRAAQQRCDPTTWAAAVTEGRPARLRELRQHWVRALAMHRIGTWLRAHPLVADKLVVQEPSELTHEALDGLDLTQADGLGAHLDQEQQQVLRLARNTLAGSFECTDNPYRLLHTRAGGIKPVLPPSVFSGSVPCFGVALLLGGLGALERLRDAGLEVPELEEFHRAIDEHRQLVNAPVPAEGVAVHALTVLDGGNLKGVGTLMASVAGAAYSTSAVVLSVSKLAGELDGVASSAVGRVGQLLLDALEDEDHEDHKALRANIDQLLGVPLLAEEEQRTAELARELERRLSKASLWPERGKAEPERPDLALLRLYRALLSRAQQQAGAARERMFGIFAALGNAGHDGSNATVAQRRIGYTVVALGMALLKDSSTEMLSAAREALAALNR